MKIKCRPEDFVVEEIPDVAPGASGRFVFYRLTKKGIGTPEAVESIRRRWNLGPDQIRYGGLKDRHAETIQYLTIANGPDRTLRQTNLELEPVGRLESPYGSHRIRGNRFSIVLRALDDQEARIAQRLPEQLRAEGIPNYFDDQRFGSVGLSGEFIANAWMTSQFERALWLALAEQNTHDRPRDRERKAIIRTHWGDWPTTKARLDRSPARSIITYLLDHPVDYRGAFARIRRDLRSIYFSAFQSHLWNRLLGAYIEQVSGVTDALMVDFRTARLPVPVGLSHEQAADLNQVRLPLHSSRNRIQQTRQFDLAVEIAQEYGIEWHDLRVRYLKDVFLAKGERRGYYQLVAPSCSGINEDELHRSSKKVTIAFELPRGAYATLLVKRIAGALKESDQVRASREADHSNSSSRG